MLVEALPETPTSAKVGDESFILVMDHSHTTVLAFRLSNAVININYGWHAKLDPQHPDQARKAAQWAAEALDRPAPTADPSDGRFAAASYACSLLPEGVPQSATRCGGLTVRHARAWRNRSGITVAEEIFAYYRREADEPAQPVKGLGGEAFAATDLSRMTLWVRVSNLVLEIRFNADDGKVTPEMRETAWQLAEAGLGLPQADHGPLIVRAGAAASRLAVEQLPRTAPELGHPSRRRVDVRDVVVEVRL
ncbi:hypothetical protein GCM10022419_084090 [Nonomuraea rosea]|uniref:Uncharacterized protein n=1 Tax=Nonomuraea rosea TaxID=638574 RepID=A0ABP6YQW0_9ACTN